jgi:hypothetical protein
LRRAGTDSIRSFDCYGKQAGERLRSNPLLSL